MFSHGQYYVGQSRVGVKSGLRILVRRKGILLVEINVEIDGV
jgi:hypothetical protein